MSTPCDIQPVKTAGRWRVLAPFRFREFRLLIAAMSLSLFAEGMWTVVMALQVIALADDPAALSLVATCLAAGMLAFILVGGIVADRVNQRAIIIAVEAANVAATGAVAVLGTLGALRLWHMAVAAAVLGIGAAFFFPAYNAYLPRILPAEQLLAANGVEGAVRPDPAAGHRSRRGRRPGRRARSRRWAPSRWPRCSRSAWCCWWRCARGMASTS